MQPVQTPQVPKVIQIRGSLKKTQRSKKQSDDIWNKFNEAHPSPWPKIECIYNKNNGVRDTCSTCNSLLSVSDDGFMACSNINCGILYTDITDQSPEWRYYGNEDTGGADPTRCGMPINPLLEESSYGCKVMCSGHTPAYMHRIRQYTEYQLIPHREKTRFADFQRITNYAQRAGIPKIIIDDALVFHKRITDEDNSSRGDNKDGIIAASIYVSCRKHGYPRTAKEIANIFHLDTKSATHGCKNAQIILGHIEKDMDMDEKTILCIPRPVDFIERYCSHLDMSKELTKLCEFIAIKISNMGIMTENTPNSIAVGIIFFVSQICKLDIRKKDINNIANISDVTINKCYKRIDMIRGQLLPTKFMQKYGIVDDNVSDLKSSSNDIIGTTS